eukprot:SAG22_NODE_3914_length_1469_cov_1.076642_3_plen_193_part_00
MSSKTASSLVLPPALLSKTVPFLAGCLSSRSASSRRSAAAAGRGSRPSRLSWPARGTRNGRRTCCSAKLQLCPVARSATSRGGAECVDGCARVRPKGERISWQYYSLVSSCSLRLPFRTAGALLFREVTVHRSRHSKPLKGGGEQEVRAPAERLEGRQARRPQRLHRPEPRGPTAAAARARAARARAARARA